MNSKQVNGTVANKDPDNAFKAKRDKFQDFNKAIAESKTDKKGAAEKEEKKQEEEHKKEMLKFNMVDEKSVIDEKKKAEEGIRIYKVPKKQTKTKTERTNKVDATLHTRTNKDSDELELGAEASTLKDGKKDDEEEEEQKIIEVYSCWPVLCAKRYVSPVSFHFCIVILTTPLFFVFTEAKIYIISKFG